LSDVESEFSHLQREQQVAQSKLPTLAVHQSTSIHNQFPLSSDVALQHASVHQEQQQGSSLLSSTSDTCEKIGEEFPHTAGADTKPEAVQPDAQSLHGRVQELEAMIFRLNEQLQNSEQALASAQDECAAYKELANVLQEVEQESQSASMAGPLASPSSDKSCCWEAAEENTKGQAGQEGKVHELHCVAGDQVNVWSKSCNQWCSGSVQRVNGENIIVEYHKPGCFQTMVKTMRCDPKEVRPQSPRQQVSNAFTVGTDVGIWSKTNQKWILGEVVKYENGMVTTKYQQPDSSEFIFKVLPEGHADLQSSDLMSLSH